jgi:hypothetical protein
VHRAASAAAAASRCIGGGGGIALHPRRRRRSVLKVLMESAETAEDKVEAGGELDSWSHIANKYSTSSLANRVMVSSLAPAAVPRLCALRWCARALQAAAGSAAARWRCWQRGCRGGNAIVHAPALRKRVLCMQARAVCPPLYAATPLHGAPWLERQA